MTYCSCFRILLHNQHLEKFTRVEAISMAMSKSSELRKSQDNLILTNHTNLLCSLSLTQQSQLQLCSQPVSTLHSSLSLSGQPALMQGWGTLHSAIQGGKGGQNNPPCCSGNALSRDRANVRDRQACCLSWPLQTSWTSYQKPSSDFLPVLIYTLMAARFLKATTAPVKKKKKKKRLRRARANRNSFVKE